MGLVLPDIGLIFWMMLSFGITFWILAKFAWKPIMKAIRNRENIIENSLNQAMLAREEFEMLRKENNEIMKQARAERDLFLQEANEIKNKLIQQSERDAKEKAEKLILQAKEQIESEKEKSLMDIKNKVAELSIDISEKILRKELSNEDSQQKYINSLLDEAKLN